MPKTLQDAVIEYLTEHGLSNKALAEKTGVSYPTILAIVKKGGIPRKSEHREALRQELGLDHDQWGLLLANSGKDGLVVPDHGPLTLQQLVTKRLYARGYTEQSFADDIDVPYATISGITRKGAIPRRDTLKQIADALDIDDDTVTAAVTVSRTTRGGESEAGTTSVEIPSFVELFSRLLAESGITMGEFAKQHDLPYLTLSRLTTAGLIPEDDNGMLELLAEELHIDRSVLLASIDRIKQGEASGSIAMRGHHTIPSDANPLQKALIGLMNREGLTIKAMSKQCGLSQLTMAKFIKGESLPSRTATHHKLQKLLNIDQHAYMALISPDAKEHLQRSAKAMANRLEQSDDGQDDPQGEDEDDVEEFVGLITQLTHPQQDALRHFLYSMVK
ncbi:MAG: helix-turn-helix domain-containing protein [Planctomycetota bacterium]